MKELAERADVVIIGGGIEGCAIAYHLAKRGVTDVLLLERKQLTCGTTWHAAGLVSQLWPTPTLTALAKYSHELYSNLETETGQATGYRRIGSLSLARNEERLEELKRTATMASVFDVESEFIDNATLMDLYPGIDTTGVLGAMYIEKDGQTNPIDTTQALAKGARNRGVVIRENCKVEHIVSDGVRVTGVVTDQGQVMADKVILAAGLWSRELARPLGVELPLYACEHFYIVTEEMVGLTRRPVLRDFDKGIYFKEDAGKMLVGWFEHNAKGCPMSRIHEDFCFDEFEVDMEHIEPYVLGSTETFPALGDTGIRTFFNGPESFTSDNLHLLGPTPELQDFYVACGMNSKGIGAGGGLGKIMADWVIDGYPSGDIWECDVRRTHPIQKSDSYVAERIPEALGHTYGMHWPFYQYTTARNLLLSPLHETLASQGACFGEVGGYERPNWFARDGAEAKYKYTYKRQNWFDFHAAEHLAVRSSLGVFDMSSFAKFEVIGANAESALQYLAVADMCVSVGKVVYTQLLDERGGINADLSIARIASDRFWVITSIGSHNRDWWHIKRHLPEGVQMVDISQDYACLSLQGPNARSALAKITEHEISADSFVFGSGSFMPLDGCECWVQRLSYVGELGFEIFIPAKYATKVYRAIMAAGAEFDICNAGLHTLNSMRLEKGFRHWGHDIGAEDNLVQAGLSFVAKPEAGDFLGRDAFAAQKAAGLPNRRLVQFLLDDPEPLLYHNEAILMDGEAVGYLTSAMYGHSLGAAMGMGYVNKADLHAEALSRANFEIDVAGERYSAKASLKAFYDPSGERMRC